MNEIDAQVIALIGRFVAAIVALTFGALFVRWGTKLYLTGVRGKSGSIKTVLKDAQFILSNGAPGTFLSAGGVIVMVTALLTMPEYDQGRVASQPRQEVPATGTKQQPQPTSSQFAADLPLGPPGKRGASSDSVAVMPVPAARQQSSGRRHERTEPDPQNVPTQSYDQFASTGLELIDLGIVSYLVPGEYGCVSGRTETPGRVSWYRPSAPQFGAKWAAADSLYLNALRAQGCSPPRPEHSLGFSSALYSSFETLSDSTEPTSVILQFLRDTTAQIVPDSAQ